MTTLLQLAVGLYLHDILDNELYLSSHIPLENRIQIAALIYDRQLYDSSLSVYDEITEFLPPV